MSDVYIAVRWETQRAAWNATADALFDDKTNNAICVLTWMASRPVDTVSHAVQDDGDKAFR